MDDIGERMHVLPCDSLQFVLDIEPAGARNQQMTFDAASAGATLRASGCRKWRPVAPVMATISRRGAPQRVFP